MVVRMGHGRAAGRAKLGRDRVFITAGLPQVSTNGMSGTIPRSSNTEFVG